MYTDVQMKNTLSVCAWIINAFLYYQSGSYFLKVNLDSSFRINRDLVWNNEWEKLSDWWWLVALKQGKLQCLNGLSIITIIQTRSFIQPKKTFILLIFRLEEGPRHSGFMIRQVQRNFSDVKRQSVMVESSLPGIDWIAPMYSILHSHQGFIL